MFKYKFYTCTGLLLSLLAVAGCKVPAISQADANRTVPVSYNNTTDTTNTASLQWRTYFADPTLVQLIDTALKYNREYLVTQQEIEIAQNDIRLRQGAILPTVTAHVGAAVNKVGRYTSEGAGDASTNITNGTLVPDVLPDYIAAVYANWEVDVWKKLRNAKKAAVLRYLASVEGRHFSQTNLIADVANTYYELLALDNQLEIIKQNIALQKNALEIVKIQKEAARVTELAVQKFQAEVLRSQSLEFETIQKIRDAENRMNFLLGRYPKDIIRNREAINTLNTSQISAGIPSQLLANRPDIKQAELNLAASKLDVKVARAEFYPSFNISAAVGLQAFKPYYLVKDPESIIFSLIGDIASPLINRSAIKAEFNSANARQLQAIYNYERTVLNAYFEVSTQLSNIENLGKSYSLKSRQVDALNKSINISNDLFKSARADYLEVLMTQRDALDAKLDLIDNKKDQLNAVVNVYRELGGGWK